MGEDFNDLSTLPIEDLKHSHILFLDLSSSCTGYAVARVDFVDKTAEFVSAGSLWFGDDWTHGHKYAYIYAAIQNYFDIVEKVDYIVAEQYSINTKKMTGCLVSPEMHGAVKASAHDVGIGISTMLPQSWRAALGIKGIKKFGKPTDFKTPTKDKVLEFCKVPDKVISNITNNPRSTPSDLYDAMAIGAAWLSKWNIKYSAKNCEFNKHIASEYKDNV